MRVDLFVKLKLVLIWSYPEQGYNSATEHFVWLVRSPGTVCHCTFVRHLHYHRSKTCLRHIFSHVPTSLTDSFQSTSSERGTLVVTLAMLLRLISCRFIIIIIISTVQVSRVDRE